MDSDITLLGMLPKITIGLISEDTSPWFSAVFAKGSNFYDFLFAPLDKKPLQNRV